MAVLLMVKNISCPTQPYAHFGIWFQKGYHQEKFMNKYVIQGIFCSKEQKYLLRSFLFIFLFSTFAQSISDIC